MDSAFYKSVMEYAPDGFAYHKIICDEKGRPSDFEYIEVNPAFARITGLRAGEIIGRGASDVLPALGFVDFDWVSFYGRVALQGLVDERRLYSRSLQRWFHITAYSSKKHYFITQLRDITVDMERLERQEIINTAFNEVIFELNEKYEFTNIYAADDSYLFKPREEILGKHINEVTDDELSASFIQAFTQASQSGKKQSIKYTLPLSGTSSNYSADVLCRESYLKEKKYLVVARDVSEQKSMEKKMKASGAQLEKFFSVNLDLLCIADFQGNFVKVNKEWESVLGFTVEEMETRKLLDFVHPGDRAATLAAMEELTQQKPLLNFVNRYLSKDGSYRYIEWRSQPYGKFFYAAARDITDKIKENEQLKLAERVLYEEKELLRVTLRSIGDAVITTDKFGTVTNLSTVAENLTGWSAEEACGRPFEEVFHIVHGTTRELCVDPVQSVLQTSAICERDSETILIARDGREIYISESAAPIRDDAGDIQGVVLAFRDITDEKQKQEKIAYLSYHDSLTGLYNRRLFEEELSRLDTSRNLPLSIIVGDVNGLKLTNDAFGHLIGDDLLKNAAAVMQEACRADDIIARWGGDEFVIILPQTNQFDANQIIERIKKLSLQVELVPINLSISFGFHTKETSDEDIQNTLKNAEDDMYKHKLMESQKVIGETITKIVNTLHASNHREKLHAARVAELCKLTGKALGLSEEETKELELAGYMHDIGKISVPESILSKTGKLLIEERNEIQRHPEVGYRILGSYNQTADIADFVLAHHERVDGCGYPKGLAAEEIPLQAKIIAVAEAFDAMTGAEQYREALTVTEAVTELMTKAGTQFDRHMVKVFVENVL